MVPLPFDRLQSPPKPQKWPRTAISTPALFPYHREHWRAFKAFCCVYRLLGSIAMLSAANSRPTVVSNFAQTPLG
jgi:hypothetical protein